MMQEMNKRISARLAEAAGISEEEARQMLTRPPSLDMGDLAFPCFPLAKRRAASPQDIARELAARLAPGFAAQGIACEAAGPYLNFRFDRLALSNALLSRVLSGSLLSHASSAQTVVIDYSSPNIAKPFSMGHLRSTSIGNALAHIYQALGWRVVRVNHLGDWGTQFGKLIVAFRLWGERARLERDGIPYLMELYVRINDEAKKRHELDDEARAAFKQLEEGDGEALALWKVFREVSLAEFERIYAILGIRFDSYAGESFYNDKITSTIDVLERAGLLAESEGALVVAAEHEGAPPSSEGAKCKEEAPCMIRKSDGASTYAARDLAAIFYRWNEYAFDRLLYVVGAPQALHFKQVFSVLKRLGLPYAERCVHVPFGQVLLNGEMMSTRRGNVIFLEDVIREAEARALEKIREGGDASSSDAEDFSEALPSDACAPEVTQPRTPSACAQERERTGMVQQARARTLAVSSIIFYDLKNGRIKDVDFNWEEILNPHGETGIYLQYAHARIHGIMRKYGERLGAVEEVLAAIPPVTEEESWPIFDALACFPEKLALAAEHNEPSIVSRFLLDLASAFSTWYRAHRVVNEENPTLSRERMAVALAVRTVLAQGLRLLGITPLEEM